MPLAALGAWATMLLLPVLSLAQTPRAHGEGEPAWLAAALLRQAETLQLSPEQRARLQFQWQHAQATWSELTRRLEAAQHDDTAGGRSDWIQLAQERGRLRVLADRDALAVLDAQQRARWRTLLEQRSQP